jgi:SAM-dependent methyltransferase
MVARTERQHDLTATEEFFGPKAAGWEKRFPDDGPAYRQAIAELAPPAGGVAVDAGCGTGRALPALREAVGPSGVVIGVDVTAAMLAEAVRLGRHRAGALVRADTDQLPLPGGGADVIFAAGLLPHCPDLAAALFELARVTRPGGRLAIFHPIGRAALAARHGRVPSDEDVVAPSRLTPALEETGFRLVLIDDSEHRYLALAERAGRGGS